VSGRSVAPIFRPVMLRNSDTPIVIYVLSSDTDFRLDIIRPVISLSELYELNCIVIELMNCRYFDANQSVPARFMMYINIFIVHIDIIVTTSA